MEIGVNSTRDLLLIISVLSGLLFIFRLFFLFVCLFSLEDYKTIKHNITDKKAVKYFNEFTEHQTIFGSRMYLSGGFNVGEYHNFTAGVDYLYEFGTTKNYYNPRLILYYRGLKGPLSFYFGSFYRKGLLKYPIFMLSDTLEYFRPNIEGIYFSYSTSKIYQDFWIDWTSKQDINVRETFLAGESGCYNFKLFFIKQYLVI